jgi:hypothetical protein
VVTSLLDKHEDDLLNMSHNNDIGGRACHLCLIPGHFDGYAAEK